MKARRRRHGDLHARRGPIHHLSSTASPYLGLNAAPTFWLDPAGNDADPGTSSLQPWASFKKAADTVYEYSSPSVVVVRVKAGSYTGVDDYFDVTKAAAPGNPGMILVCEPGVILDGTAAVDLVNRNGFEFSTGSNWPVILYGNGGIIRNYANPYGSANGIGNRGSNILDAHDWIIDNCDDAVSGHGNAFLNLYDIDASNCTKSAFAHVDNATTTHTRCRFTDKSGASLGIGANLSTVRSSFVDTIFIPSTSGVGLGLNDSDVLRCQLGTTSKRVFTTAGAGMAVSDSFINFSADINQPRSFDRCYGFFTARQRNGGLLTLERSVIAGPASGQANVFFSNFDPGSGSQHLVRSNIFKTASAAAFMSYDSTNAGYLVAALSEFFNNVLSGAAQFDPDLLAADSGGTVVVDNLLADALIGAANTVNPDDYGYTTGSPAIGAGVGGSNAGFAAGEISAPSGPRVLP